jgi:predicted ATPase
MPYLKSFSIDVGREHPFPFNVPAVKFAKNIRLDPGITILVGDNGSGKSTLLEGIALQLDIPLIGGHIKTHPGFEGARLLQPWLNIITGRMTSKGFFFRAEDFSDFINSVELHKTRINQDLRTLEGEVDEAVIDKMRESMNFALQNMRREYGENMQAFSHGEAYLKIIQTRISNQGIYLLDEPEAALSPLKQLSLISFIMEALKNNNSQFIIATHSPILMGIPNALIYEIQEDGIQPVEYKETEHYRITHTFLNHPEVYLRHL